jgi:hypothetical protein
MSATVELVDSAAARRSLREQIARLEGELARTLASTYPRIAAQGPPITHGGPKLLDLGQLEITRDALAARVADVRRRAQRQERAQAEARALLEDMRANPERHKGRSLTAAELGLRGCMVYSVRKRVLTGWWRVKVSSGCP